MPSSVILITITGAIYRKLPFQVFPASRTFQILKDNTFYKVTNILSFHIVCISVFGVSPAGVLKLISSCPIFSVDKCERFTTLFIFLPLFSFSLFLSFLLTFSALIFRQIMAKFEGGGATPFASNTPIILCEIVSKIFECSCN